MSLATLLTKGQEKYSEPYDFFHYFDFKKKGAITFSDFSYRVEELELKVPRELVVQMFAYLD